ncbi:proline-rich nuclear receptor coactivator 2-like [Neovison vison]|uniref:proline-rich nuclear receptor coactivator 2-like n=1 Tax=Neovison vison TaxID=452646 RepID=UPI001CEFEBD9|nr:proline-rich nuclear receptor coactivator 2-like [Neogale vison]
MGGGERYNIPAPQSRNVSKNQQQLNRQKTKDQNSQMKIVHKKKERGHTYTSSAAARQAMQNGGKNKNFPNHQNWNSSLSSPSLLLKSQTNQNDAGAKFSEPPSPSVLPKPPSHWVPVSFNPSDKEITTFQLKTLLKGRLGQQPLNLGRTVGSQHSWYSQVSSSTSPSTQKAGRDAEEKKRGRPLQIGG